MPAWKRYCFTLNNYTAEHIERLKAIELKYICFQKEVAPTTLTPHVQGYMEFDKQTSVKQIHKLLGFSNIAMLAAKGTALQNKAYCSKDGGADFYERGEFSSQGQRTDIAAYVSAIKEGKTLCDIITTFPEEYCRYHSAFDKILLAIAPTRNWVMDVRWYYGPTGTGKSHAANELASDRLVYRKPAGKWWDGYQGQEVVIMDEYRPDWFPFHQLLTLTDKYPLQVEVKGGFRQFSSKVIIFTSPQRWNDMYRGQTEEKLDQLQRRITETRLFPYKYILPALETTWDNQIFTEGEGYKTPDRYDWGVSEGYKFDEKDYDFILTD